MATSLDTVQENFASLVKGAFVQNVVEQTIDDTFQVPRNASGDVEPTIIYSFGVLQNGKLKSMGGVRGHDYLLPVYLAVVSPTPAITRKLSNKLLDVVLGFETDWTGQSVMRPGGSLFPIASSDVTVEATMWAGSMSIPVQFSTD